MERSRAITVEVQPDGWLLLDVSKNAGPYGRHIAQRLKETGYSPACLLEYCCREGAYLEFHDVKGARTAPPRPVHVLALTVEQIAAGRAPVLQLFAALDPDGNEIVFPTRPSETEQYRETA